jgi:hypothetical protein
LDVTDDALAAGIGTAGNQFEFNVDKWQYNLKTSNYTGSGTLLASLLAGVAVYLRLRMCGCGYYTPFE